MKQAAAALTVILALVASCSQKPPTYVSHETAPATQDAEPALGPLNTALQGEITQALQATEWPQLDPSMDAVITEPVDDADVLRCVGTAIQDPNHCTWGPPTALRIIVVGDSVALNYVEALRQIALTGQIQVHTEAMPGCAFVDDLIRVDGAQELVDACPGRKQHAIDLINTTRPDVVIISNSYGPKPVADGHDLTPAEWSESMQRIVPKFRNGTPKVVLLAPPPDDVNIGDCYSRRSSTPADCISKVTTQWKKMADAEQAVAKAVDGTWIDSRPWFCSKALCPSFVGTTPTKHDLVHMSPAYAAKIAPVIAESLSQAGVL